MDDLRGIVKSIGYCTESCSSPHDMVPLLASRSKIHAIVLSVEADADLRGAGALDVLRMIQNGGDLSKMSVLLVPENDSPECAEIVASAMQLGPCLLVPAPVEASTLRQTLQVCSMLQGSGGRASPRPRVSYSPMNSARTRPQTGTNRMAHKKANPISSSMTPRYTNRYSPEPDAETARENKEEDEELAKNPAACISGYVGFVPGIRTATYGRSYPETVKDGPRHIVPDFRDESRGKFHAADEFYPRGCQTQYARQKKNLRNRAHITLGDNRVNDMQTSSKEFYPDFLMDQPKSEISMHMASLTPRELAKYYAKMEMRIGQEAIDKLEAATRDKVMMYTSGGPGALRRQFKYFDRDASGFVDFDEFKYALTILGMNVSDEDLVAFFARYDDECRTYLSYTAFVNKLLDDPSSHRSVMANVEANVKLSLGRARRSRVPLNATEAAAQRKLVKDCFDQLDTNGSGELEMVEVHKMCQNMGIVVSVKDLRKLLNKMDSDKSGSCSFEEFFTWYCSY